MYDRLRSLIGVLKGCLARTEPAPPPADVSVWRLPGDGEFQVIMAGAERYQAELRRLLDEHTAHDLGMEFTALLTPEFSGWADLYDIVVRRESGARVGYLTRKDARAYQQVVRRLHDRGVTAACAGELSGGTAEDPTISVRLDLGKPEDLLDAIEAKL